MSGALEGLACLIAVWTIVTVLYVVIVVFVATPKHTGGISFDLSLLTRSPIYWTLLAACSLSGLYLVFSRR